jgi:small-conductance mechanosensitive channel
MRRLLLLCLLLLHSHAATIDTALYEGANVATYFQKIEHDINNTIVQKLKSEETISLERSTLKKLKQLYEIKDKVKPFKTIKLDKKEIKEQTYLSALYHLATLRDEIKRLEDKEKDIQQKLFELKSSIEKTLPNDTNHSLLKEQLQYAFYRVSQEKIENSLKLYTQLFTQEFSKFQTALLRVHFKENRAKKIIKHTDKKMDEIQQKNLLLTIDKDSEAQRSKKAQANIITKEKSIQKETDSALMQKIKAQLLLSLKWLKEKNQKAFLKSTGEIESDFKALSQKEKKKVETLIELLIMMGDKRFDESSIVLASTEHGFHYIKNSLQKFLNKTLFVYQDKAFSINTIFTFALIIMIGLIIAKLYKNIVDRFRKTKRIKSLSTARLIANSGYYLIILATFFTALNTIGLDMHTIFVVIGAILLWLALGLQGFISNYAMGILIKIDRSIRIGDHVELDAETVGDVDDMDFRSITIKNSDDTRITIPNSRFIGGSFINHTLEGSCRRIHIPFSAQNTIPHQHIEQTILTALQKSAISYINTSEKRAHIIITDINRKITRYALYVWVKQEEAHDLAVKKSQFLKLIHQNLLAIGASQPFAKNL